MKFSRGNEFASVRPLLELLQTDLPIIQAPMAGTSSPAASTAPTPSDPSAPALDTAAASAGEDVPAMGA